MDLSLLKLGDKVKLELKQPAIKCVGRKNVTCHYRAKLMEILENDLIFKIKVFGQEKLITFNKNKKIFTTYGYQDLYIK